MRRYTNSALTSAQIITELVELSREMYANRDRARELGLTETSWLSMTPWRRTSLRSASSAATSWPSSPGTSSAPSAPTLPWTGRSASRSKPCYARRSSDCSRSTVIHPTARRRPSISCCNRPKLSPNNGRRALRAGCMRPDAGCPVTMTEAMYRTRCRSPRCGGGYIGELPA